MTAEQWDSKPQKEQHEWNKKNMLKRFITGRLLR